jgi:hypothetical protein
MDNKELLQRASNEIKGLRSQNQLMAARLEVFDSMMLLFTSDPQRSGGTMSPDIVWEIDRAISVDELNQGNGKAISRNTESA